MKKKLREKVAQNGNEEAMKFTDGCQLFSKQLQINEDMQTPCEAIRR